LVSVLPSDADNLYITLTARVLNPKLFIIARAEQPTAEAKLRRVGANQIVSPYLIGGHRIAQAVLRPTVGHFLEQAMRRGEGDYIIEEIPVLAPSPFCNKSLRELDIGHRLGVVVISIKRPHGDMVFNPQGDTVIEAGAILVVVGHRQQLLELERLASSA
jgi:voltage-gated potassium channel